MRVGIDASNLRAGGGITHLVQLLRAADPARAGISKVVVWAGVRTLERLTAAPWLTLSHQPTLDRSLAMRLYWQRNALHELAARECDLLFAPGGSYSGQFRPFVTMSRNMLPFEPVEARRFGLSWDRLKLTVLRQIQSRSFAEADGVIFLNDYARTRIMSGNSSIKGAWTVIPHGVDYSFLAPPRVQKSVDYFSHYRPFRLLYVSIINVYKHQAAVAAAVGRLRARGYPLELELVGAFYPPALQALRDVLRRIDRGGAFIRYRGEVDHDKLPEIYHSADAFVFASSCENMPNILLEAMASGLPIACSRKGPMPEVLGGAGFYFDPDNSTEIEGAIEQLLLNPASRLKIAREAHGRAKQYSWTKCAHETFEFLAEVSRRTR